MKAMIIAIGLAVILLVYLLFALFVGKILHFCGGHDDNTWLRTDEAPRPRAVRSKKSGPPR